MSDVIIDFYFKCSVIIHYEISFENLLINSQSINVLLFYMLTIQNLITTHCALPESWTFECTIEFFFFCLHLPDL